MRTAKLFILILVLVFNSCKKDETSPASTEAEKIPPSPSVTLKKFSCYINGVLFNTDAADSNIYYIDTLGSYKILACGGMIDSTWVGFGIAMQGISLSLPSGVSTYPTISVSIDRAVNGIYYDSYNTISSSIQFTSHDSINHKVSGTFSGVAVENSIHDTVHISNGIFTNLSYLIY